MQAAKPGDSGGKGQLKCGDLQWSAASGSVQPEHLTRHGQLGSLHPSLSDVQDHRASIGIASPTSLPTTVALILPTTYNNQGSSWSFAFRNAQLLPARLLRGAY